MNSPYISTKSEAALKETAQQAAVRALAEACDIYPEELLGHLGMGWFSPPMMTWGIGFTVFNW